MSRKLLLPSTLSIVALSAVAGTVAFGTPFEGTATGPGTVGENGDDELTLLNATEQVSGWYRPVYPLGSFDSGYAAHLEADPEGAGWAAGACDLDATSPFTGVVPPIRFSAAPLQATTSLTLPTDTEVERVVLVTHGASGGDGEYTLQIGTEDFVIPILDAMTTPRPTVSGTGLGATGSASCGRSSMTPRSRSRLAATLCQSPLRPPSRRNGSNISAIAVKKDMNSPMVLSPAMISRPPK